MGNRTALAVVVCPSRAAQSPESRHQRVRHRQPHNAVTSPTGGHRAPFPPGRFTAAAPHVSWAGVDDAREALSLRSPQGQSRRQEVARRPEPTRAHDSH
jgi:hypothetical protein